MNIFFLIIGVLVILLIIIVIFILMNDNSSNKSKNNSNKTTESNSKIFIKDIEFPKSIEQMSHTSLSQITKGMFDSYNALDYSNKSGNALEKAEWHSWQVSILLVFLKVYQEFFVPYDKKIFHSSILNLSEEVLKNEIQKIFRKYKNNVNIKKSRDTLSNEIIWSPREVSIILYSIMNNKKY